MIVFRKLNFVGLSGFLQKAEKTIGNKVSGFAAKVGSSTLKGFLVKFD